MDKKQLEKIISHPLLIVLVTCFTLLSIFSLRESAKKALVSKESIEKLEKSTKKLENDLLLEQQKIDTNQEQIAVEKILRNELLQKREGEIVLQVPDQEQIILEKNENSQIQMNGPLNEWKQMFNL